MKFGEAQSYGEFLKKKEAKQKETEKPMQKDMQTLLAQQTPAERFLSDALTSKHGIRPETNGQVIRMDVNGEKKFESMMQELLTPPERPVIQYYYGFEDGHRHTVDECSKHLGISQEECNRQLHKAQKRFGRLNVEFPFYPMNKEEERQETRDAQKAEKKQERPKEEQNEKRHDLQKQRKETARTRLEHDMRDEALGQISGIPGANIDYDELNKMAKNNIRDAGELVSESLQNDGYDADKTRDIGEAVNVMTGYVQGDVGLDKVNELNDKYDMGTIARAYTETVKQSSMRDAGSLERISDICGFDSPAYEGIFDRLQAEDPEVSMVLDKLDMAMGRERE